MLEGVLLNLAPGLACDIRDSRGPDSIEEQIISFVWRIGKKESEAFETLRSG